MTPTRYAIAGKTAGETLSPDLDRRRDEIAAARAELSALSAAQLKTLHDAAISRSKAKADALATKRQADQRAKEIAKEAARFCNQAGATADFAHWCIADYWTLDEAVALLLNKDPGIVNPQAFERESSADRGLFTSKADKATGPAGFARTYERLRTLMARADALNGPWLKPSTVVEWARSTQAVEIPEPLTLIALPTSPPPPNEPALTATAALLPQMDGSAALPTARQTDTTRKKWTEEFKSEVAAYREEHGTKKTAAHYGISPARLRAQLPAETRAPAGYSAFSHRVK